jgi:hypothetical protein
MTSSKRDFEGFVSWLHASEAPIAPDVKRLTPLPVSIQRIQKEF